MKKFRVHVCFEDGRIIEQTYDYIDIESAAHFLTHIRKNGYTLKDVRYFTGKEVK